MSLLEIFFRKFIIFFNLFSFICLKKLQDNYEPCPDFEVRFCCRRDYFKNNLENSEKHIRVKREPKNVNSVEINDILRNIHAFVTNLKISDLNT